MISEMADQPPVANVPQSQEERYKHLSCVFEKRYGKPPDFFARAPGRVNLIGEHIDYNGYAVLPMAIEQDIVIAAAGNESQIVRLANIDPQYKEHSFNSSLSEVNIDHGTIDWYKYFLCGYKGLLEHTKLDKSVGLDLLLDGTVPRSAGLSSSSAFVCCSALATMFANGKKMTKLELAELCQNCEKYIGTEGGGMDQAISFLAEPGTAKYVEFNPIKAFDVKLPEGAVFVISNSCVEMNKAATPNFNTRVAECRLASQILAKARGLNWKDFKNLGDVQKKLGESLASMLLLVEATLHSEPYSKEEVCQILGVTAKELDQISLSEKSWHVEHFKLFDRAHHVFSEAGYVRQFREACESNLEGALIVLGKLMSASHTTCSQKYECSCKELDQLVTLALESGALGSRLTGAGWGGCSVSLVPADRLESFMEKMNNGYYKSNPRIQDQVGQALFATQPGGGAAIFKL